jgi:hypothetical protein
VVVAVAEETGAPFVNVRERFARELETKVPKDLFVEDGHCNAGYAIIAAEVGDAVAGLLGK